AAVFVGLTALGGALSIAGIGALPPLAWTGLALFSVCHFGLLSEGRERARVRAAVALAFGLVHGLGFAGILMEMDLPPERLLPALVAFNVGVEIGQFAFVLAAWPFLAWLAARHRPWRLGLAESGSAFVLGLGLYWVIVRST
ncbi:MAG: HupE/UreJ family protein, partial [Candidatus Binatia bacterium]